MKYRAVWGLSLVLAGLVLLGAVPLVGPYWVARFRGDHAELQAAMLTHAPLRNTRLTGADLQGANLDSADLTGADLNGADLRRARLLGVRLARAQLTGAWLQQADLRGADLTGALYDSRTYWPAGVDPVKRGAIRVVWLYLPATVARFRSSGPTSPPAPPTPCDRAETAPRASRRRAPR